MKQTISIVIPVRNEELYLPACLKSIHDAAEYANINFEIIVVINRCTDSSEKIADANNCIIIHNNSKNLSSIRNQGINAASNDIVFTVDADSRLSQNLFLETLNALEKKNIVGGGVLIFPERYSTGIILSGLLLAPIALYYGIQAGVFFFHKKDFLAIGGFDETLLSAEDIDFAIRLKKQGKKTGRKFAQLFRSHIITSCRKFDRLGDWYFIKNIRQTISLLQGKNKEAANKIWYDFKR